MDLIEISAEDRALGGKGDIKRLKSEGMIPAVLYSEGGSIPISLNEHEIRNILNKSREDIFLNLVLNSKTIKVKVKEVGRNPVTQDILHVDLMPVEEGYIH